jgi:hypothetical protein
MRTTILYASFCILLMASCADTERPGNAVSVFIPGAIAVPAINFDPEHYVCYRAGHMTIDGDITDAEWANAPWSTLFRDIEGNLKPEPLYDTRVKMMWDDRYLYIAAELKEPDIWATLRQRDTVIYYDNDFEVFIDPDNDTHGYYEFEMNAYNTVWDLLLTRPYRDYGKVIDAWDITGLKSAVKIYGTINDPSDRDDRWTVELAFPFEVLNEWGNMPVNGTQWRMNFSRVNWKIRTENGKYAKETDHATGRILPEYNWLWSPQGLINVHYPELWGFVQFSSSNGSGEPAAFIPDPDEMVRWELRRLYYAERAFSSEKKHYTAVISMLGPFGYKPSQKDPEIMITMSGYEASLPAVSKKGFIFINSQGLTWESPAK